MRRAVSFLGSAHGPGRQITHAARARRSYHRWVLVYTGAGSLSRLQKTFATDAQPASFGASSRRRPPPRSPPPPTSRWARATSSCRPARSVAHVRPQRRDGRLVRRRVGDAALEVGLRRQRGDDGAGLLRRHDAHRRARRAAGPRRRGRASGSARARAVRVRAVVLGLHIRRRAPPRPAGSWRTSTGRCPGHHINIDAQPRDAPASNEATCATPGT